MKYEYEIIKTKKIVDRYRITSTDKLSIDEIEEYVREECLFVGQSKKFTLFRIRISFFILLYFFKML